MILSTFAAILIHPLWILPAGELLIYYLILMTASFQISFQKKNWKLFFGIPPAISTMHFSWGLGFLWSIISGNSSNKADSMI
jgi:hypothetical protein